MVRSPDCLLLIHLIVEGQSWQDRQKCYALKLKDVFLKKDDDQNHSDRSVYLVALYRVCVYTRR